MFGIGYGPPILDFVPQVQEIGHHFQGHDDFVEVIEVIGRQQGLLVDIGAVQTRLDFLQVRFRIRSGFVGWGHCAQSSLMVSSMSSQPRIFAPNHIAWVWRVNGKAVSRKGWTGGP